MIVQLPDGRKLDVPTEDPELAKDFAIQWSLDNPFVPKGAQLGEEDISVWGDIPRGIGAGLVGAAEGLATLPAEFINLIDNDDEDEAEEVRKFFAKYKPDVHTKVGEAVKFITQFAVPGGIAAKAAKAFQLGKAGQIGSFAAADFVATTPDVETLGDFFDVGPTKRIETKDLEGIEKSSAELTNRLKVASEGAMVLLGAPYALGKIGAGIGIAADAAAKTDLVKNAARAIKDPNTPFMNVGGKPDLGDPTWLSKNANKMTEWARKNLTWQEKMPDRFAKTLQSLRVGQINAANNKAAQSMQEIDHGLRALSKAGKLNEVDESMALDSLSKYMFGKGDEKAVAKVALEELNETINKIGKQPLFGKRRTSLLDAADDLRKNIDELSTGVKDEMFLNPETQEKLINKIDENILSYGTRLYRSIKETGYMPTEAQRALAKKELEGFGVNSIEVDGMLDQLLKMKDFTNAKMKPEMAFEESTLKGVAQGILKGRKLDNLPAVRDFLGEYTGDATLFGRVKNADGTFKEAAIRQRSLPEQKLGFETKVIETVDKLAKMTTKAQYYKNLDKYSNDIGTESFLFDSLPANMSQVDRSMYSRIGVSDMNPAVKPDAEAIQKYGPLAGKYVKTEHANAFESIPGQWESSANSVLWSTFLGAKGLSQLMKTVYSPITQIRNATTASFFALKNGNIGNLETLSDSVRVVLNQINQGMIDLPGGSGNKKFATQSDLNEFYNEQIELGVVNTNSKMGELDSLLKDAAGAERLIGGEKTRKVFQWAENRKNKFSGKLYQGSDDVWKIYSYQMERGKLADAIKKEPNVAITSSDPENLLEFGRSVIPSQLDEADLKLFLNRESASIVKDTVPNYARVPEQIKRLRAMPVGNFIAFPAEVLRTSGNILGRATRELGSDSAAIRSIGMKRLLGSLTVDAGLYGGLMAGGLALTGSDMEQVNAFKRSFAMPWERNAMLIPLATDKEGNITEFYNFSYTNPYDFMTRPARAIFNAVNSGVTSEKDLNEIAWDASTESFWEFFSPFLGESIVSEKLLDLLRNRTRFESQIWNPNDEFGTRITKGFAHFVDGLTPGVSPVTLEGDATSPTYMDLKFKDFPKSIGLTFGADPVTGVNRQGARLDPMGEFVEALSGLKSVRNNIKKTLEYRGYEGGQQVREAAGIFNRLAKSSGNVEAADLTKAHLIANEQRFKSLRDLHMAIEDARTLGLSDKEIIKSLTKARTPHLGALLSGKFIPWFPSEDTITFALLANENKLANPFDMTSLGETYKSFAGKPFRPQVAEEREMIKEQLSQQAPMQQPIQMPTINPQQPPPVNPQASDVLREIEIEKLTGS